MKTLSLLMLCLSLCVSAGDEAAMRFKGGVLYPDPADGLEVVPDSVRGAELLLLHFAALPSPEALTRNGVVPLYYAGENTLYALVPTGFHLDDFAELRWMGALPAGFKVADEAAAALFADDAPQSLLVYGFPGMAAEDLADRIAEAGGYSTGHAKLPNYVQLVSGDVAVVQALSRMPEITWIAQAPADHEIVHFCAGAVTPYGPVAEFSTNGNGWDGAGLGSASLTYRFVSGTGDISGTGEYTPIINAFSKWAAVANLTFTQTSTTGLNRSIDIKWATGSHGDGSSFDGPGNVLAHAFYPVGVNSEPIAGDMHFDDAETWSLTTTYDVFSVALHEIGHSLGLAHSSNSSAVMAPTYKKVTGLHSDDINGIRSLYSSGTGLTAPTASVFHECLGINDMMWNSISGATSYQVYRGTSTSSGSASLWQTVTGTFVSANTTSTIYLWVKACNSGGCSPFSNRVSAYYTSGACP